MYIHFPNFNPVFVSIGFISIYWYGLMYLISFIFIMWYGKKIAIKKK